MTINVKNERVKRNFFLWLKNADGCCDSTINSIEKAVLLYQDFTKGEDFSLFNRDKAVDFKRWLTKREFRGKHISLVTYYTYLRYLRKFFNWLCREQGYKSRVKPNEVEYFKITDKEQRIATQVTPRNYPTLEYVKKLTDSIKPVSEIDRRDRALIAFTLLSGMRDKAIATLPRSCFDEDALTISQNPRQGVATKFSKLMPVTLFQFDEGLVEEVLEWAKHLKEKGFGSQDPLFPRSKLEHGKDGLAFEVSSKVAPAFWKGTGRIREIFKRRAEEAGLRYYPPHTFRHLASALAFKACKNGEDIKAISQNFGHEHIATTISVYGNYEPAQLSEIIKKMNFSEKHKLTLDEKIDKVLLAFQNKML